MEILFLKRSGVNVLLLVMMLLFMSPLTAYPDEVSTPVLVSTTSASRATMCMPRWKGYVYPDSPNTFWLSYANGGGDVGNLNVTTDGGQTWNTDNILVGGYLDFHVSMFGLDGDLNFTWPAGAGIQFRKFDYPANSEDDGGSYITIANTSVWHRSNVMTEESGRIWVFTRRTDYPEENVLYHYSDDYGSSWTSGTAVSANVTSVRIGSMPYIDGAPALVVLYLSDSRGYEYYLWNGTNFESRPDHSIYAANMGEIRTFTHNVVNDTTMHLIFGYGSDLYHIWKNYNGGNGSWSTQIIGSSSYTLNNDWTVTSTVQGDNLYLFYGEKLNSSLTSSMIYYRKWSQTDETWTEPELVSVGLSDQTNRDPNTSMKVPANSDYIPVFWSNVGSGGYNIYYNKVILESPAVDSIPPAAISDLE